jgi:hypothetical protein
MLGLLLALAMPGQHQVSLCAVLNRPASYRHRVVSIPAEILLALPHGAILLDKKCPRAALRLGFDLPEAGSSATNLISAIEGDCSDPRPDRVAGVFTGKLAYSADGRIELRLVSVKGLQTHSCAEPPTPSPMVSSMQPGLM